MKLLDYFASFLKETVNLDDERLALLDLRVEAIVAALGLDETVGPLLIEHIPQGSWAHKTIICPLPGDEFDADFLLRLEEVPEWADSPKEYLKTVRSAFRRHTDYADKVEKKNRCVRIRYANACHVDVVLYIVRVDEAGLETGVIVDFAENAWEETNPLGFTDWINEKDQIAKSNLRRVIRLLKYVRDYKGTFSAKSVILTTLVGERVLPWKTDERYKDVPTTLVSVLEDLDAWLGNHDTMPPLPDPSCPDTTFNHRWTEAEYQNFRTQIARYAAWAREAYDEPDKTASLAAWQRIFGDDFKAPTSTISESALVKAAAPAPEASSVEEFIENDASVTGYAGIGTATIEASFEPFGGGRRRPLALGRPVFKGGSLTFEVKTTDIPQPFQVIWKVRNFGEDARRAGGLRGQLMPGTVLRKESTLYRGKHHIECFIVKNGRVMAFDRFVVRII